MSHRPRGAILALLAVALLLPSCSTDEASITAPALWYGKRADGSPTSGVTPVSVTAVRTDAAAPFAIDLSGLTSETDAAWRSTAWAAGAQAMLNSGLDPRGRALRIDVDESIGGPSAGAIIAAASEAALLDGTLRSGITATGTVLPDGAVGPVSGIPDKLRGAQEADLTEVLIPAGQTESADVALGTTVNTQEYGQSLGLTVEPAANVQQVLEAVGEGLSTRPIAAPAPPDAQLDDLTAAAVRASLERMASPAFAVSPAPPGLPQERADSLSAAVADARTRAPELLAAGRPVEALVLAGTTERAVAAWNGGAAAAAELDARGVAAATSQVSALATEVERTATSQRAQAAASAVTTDEGYPSLADALGWATDAITTARVTRTAVDSAEQTPSTLAGHAADLAQVTYDTRVYLPLAVAAATTAIGTATPDSRAALARLDAYAKVLAEAAAANTAYFEAVRTSLGADAELPDGRLAADLAGQWRAGPSGREQADVLVRTAVALAHYVSSTALVAGAAEFRADTSASDPTQRMVLADEESFNQQVDSAAAAVERQAALLTGSGQSSQYLMWNRAWGTAQARAPIGGAISAQTRREGLVYLWYASTSGRMLPTTAATEG